MNAQQRRKHRRFLQRNQVDVFAPRGMRVNSIRLTFGDCVPKPTETVKRTRFYHICQSIRRGLLRVGMFTGMKTANVQEA